MTNNITIIEEREAKTLLDWVNESLNANYARIDELCTGAAYCQLMHKLFPDKINLERIKFLTIDPIESMQNFLLFQAALYGANSTENVPIGDLIEYNFLPHLKFLLKFKSYYDINYKPPLIPYDALAERFGKTIGYGMRANGQQDIDEEMSRLKINEHIFTMSEYLSPQKDMTELTSLLEKFENEKKVLIKIKAERDLFYRKLCKIKEICKLELGLHPAAAKILNILHFERSPSHLTGSSRKVRRPRRILKFKF